MSQLREGKKKVPGYPNNTIQVTFAVYGDSRYIVSYRVLSNQCTGCDWIVAKCTMFVTSM